MPIYERDPWRAQYFTAVHCPRGVHIPTDDIDAYQLNPEHCWIYDKLLIARSQGIACAPHGIDPSEFPVFSKPIVNLHGMGVDSRRLDSLAEYQQHYRAGHMWMTHLHGEHVSTDLAVVKGRVVWLRHSVGKPAGNGTFDFWTVEATTRAALESYLRSWVSLSLPSYTGMLNVESIDGKIIEAHLRFTDQWPDLYGEGWLEAVVELYATQRWTYVEPPRKTGFSTVLFCPHGVHYQHPPEQLIAAQLAQLPHLTSVQITFHEDRAPESHAMPPGGFRVAIINGHCFGATCMARLNLRQWFMNHSDQFLHSEAVIGMPTRTTAKIISALA